MQLTYLSLALLAVAAPMMAAPASAATHAAAPKAALKKTEAAITKDGKTIWTIGQQDAFVEKVTESDPNIAFYRKIDPSLDAQLLEAKVRQLVMDEYAQAKDLAHNTEYAKELAEGLAAYTEMLNQKFFIKAHVTEVNDAEALRHYNENKDKDPMLVAVPAGITAQGVLCTTQAEADKIAAQARAANLDLAKVIAGSKLKVQDFGAITKMSMNVDPAVKNKVLATAKFPNMEVVKAGDKEFWVVKVIAKQEVQHRAFEQVKDSIKQKLTSERIEKMLQTKVQEYKQQYKITENPVYLASLQQQAEAQRQEADNFIAQMLKEQEEQQKAAAAQKPAQKPAAAKAAHVA